MPPGAPHTINAKSPNAGKRIELLYNAAEPELLMIIITKIQENAKDYQPRNADYFADIEALTAVVSELDQLDQLDNCLSRIATSETPRSTPQPAEAKGFEAPRPKHCAVQTTTPLYHPLSTALSPLSTALSPLSTALSPLSTALQTPTTRGNRKSGGNANPASWRNLNDRQQFTAVTATAERQGGHAFTLNISEDLQLTLGNHKDPTRLASHYINRELKAAGLSGTAYSFALETSPTGKLHLHGVFIPDLDKAAATKNAFMRAGGKLSGRSASRQLKITPITDAKGWSAYCKKQISRTLQTLAGERAIFISQEMTRLATQDHNERCGIKRRPGKTNTQPATLSVLAIAQAPAPTNNPQHTAGESHRRPPAGVTHPRRPQGPRKANARHRPPMGQKFCIPEPTAHKRQKRSC